MFVYLYKQPTYEGVRLGLARSSVSTIIIALFEYVSKVTRPIDRNTLINMIHQKFHLNRSTTPDMLRLIDFYL